MYDFTNFTNKLDSTKNWLIDEYRAIRTGRAVPSLLDSISVDAYGSRTAIPHLASVGVEDARTLRISPYDPGLVKDIERAITVADLGVSVSVGDTSILVSFPELTAERRTLLIKTAKTKLEEARKTLRGARDEVWGDIQKRERDNEISEDDKFRAKDELEKKMTNIQGELEELLAKKEKEIED